MQEYLDLFKDEERAVAFLRETRWPNGIGCPRCGVVGRFSVLSRPLRSQPACRRYQCLACDYQFSDLAGTPLQGSQTPVRKWLLAAYLLAQGKGISARRLSRELRVTYKTAWRMAHQLRGALMGDLSRRLGGASAVETDDTYIGGRRKKGPRGRGARGKTAVLGLVERGGQVYCRVVPAVSRAEIVATVQRWVLPGSVLYSDALPAYKLPPSYHHTAIDHEMQFVGAGAAHTNTIEGFWSLLKRGLNGVYHWVSRRWLPAYLAEFCFRYNHRHEANPFPALLRQCLQPVHA